MNRTVKPARLKSVAGRYIPTVIIPTLAMPTELSGATGLYSADYAVERCLSISPSVCLSVTPVFCPNGYKHIITCYSK